MNRRAKVLLTAAVALPMALGGAGTAYASHYQDRALPGSTVGAVAVSGMTRQQVADVVEQRARDLTVTLRSGSVSRTAHLADLGYRVDVGATVDAVFAANGSWSSYATSLLSSRNVPAVVRSDSREVDTVVSDLVAQAGKAGRDAGVRLGSDRSSFVVVPAVPGETVDPTTFQDVVESAARGLSPTTTTLGFVHTDPAVTNAAAARVAAEANALVARSVVVSDGSTRHAASPTVKASWVTIPTSTGTLGAPEVDPARVRAWVNGLAKDAAVNAVDGLRNVSAAGAVLSVVTPARDGRSVANAPDVAAATVAALAAGRDSTQDFTYDTHPATWRSRTVAVGAEHLPYPAADGEKWIDVDLTRHTMTAYVGATVVNGPIAMVNGAPATPTVVGTFHVYLKNPLMTMRGRNADGTNYETPDVPWTSFFTGGYALHGAPWRSTFGYAASHGCINLPVDVAKWVYDFAPIGTPVVTHY